MRSFRYSFSLGLFGFELCLWRKERGGTLRDPMAHMKLRQKLKILRGHALKKNPSNGGAREKAKQYKYYKKKRPSSAASYVRVPSNYANSRRRAQRRNRNTPSPRVARDPS